MAFERFYATSVGNSYLAQAHAGKKLIISRCAIGTGYLESGQSQVSQKALVSYLCDMPIAGSSTSGGALNVRMNFSNALPGGGFRDPFWWSEVGLYGSIDGDSAYPEALLFYANTYDSAHADYIPGTLTEFVFTMSLNSLNASDDVTVNITQSLVYAMADHTHAISDVTGLTDTLDGKAAASHTHAASDITGLAETYSVTLSAASWSGGAYTVSNSAFGADSKLIMALSESASAEQAQACRDAMIRVTAHAAGSITLTADGDVPGVDVPIDVIKIG